jgi:hypothetical protein
MQIAFHDPYLPSGMEIAVGARRCSSLQELMGISDVLGKEPADPSHPLIATWRNGARYDALMSETHLTGWH